MKSFKCLMGVLLSTVLLFGSVFAANTLHKNGIAIKEGFDVKSQSFENDGFVQYQNLNERKSLDNSNTRDCSACDNDYTEYGSECCDTAWLEYGLNCATLEGTYGWDCSGCTCPGDDPDAECPDGTVEDCADDDCCPESWIGDGYEDCEDQAYGCDLTCYDNDGGDCGTTDPYCGDGACNGDETADSCPEDCAGGGCDAGYVDDCSGDGDCCPESWIGDGYEDCEDQAYGCDLTCYDNDGGDCAAACPDGQTECWDGSCVSDPADCPDAPDCSSSFTVHGSDPSGYYGACWSDGSAYFFLDWEGGCLATGLEYSGGFMDITSYGFTEGFYFYGFEAGATETFIITFDGGASSANEATAECDGSQSCADLGMLDDCSGDGDCCPESWVGDGYEDCEDQAYGCDLTCYDNDGGDCGPVESCEDQGLVTCPDGSCADSLENCSEVTCPDGYVDDCSGDGDCCPESWIGDGYEDCEEQIYGCDLTCYDNDGGDCPEDCEGYTCWDGSCVDDPADCPDEPEAPNAPGDVCIVGSDYNGYLAFTATWTDDNDPEGCGDGYVEDCADDDCCPESWIGDGYEDCEDQAYGCDLTCYDNDGGDCGTTDPYCGDGACNGDETADSCPEDCAGGGCDAGYVDDCSGDGDCCPESWIGDGYEDCEDQAYGCDLTCYDNDGGDCGSACPDGQTECWDGSCVNDPADCPETPGCAESFIAYGSDPSGYYGGCWSDGTGYYLLDWEGGCLATGLEYSGGFMDITSYGFTDGFFFYGFEPGATETFILTFEDGSSAASESSNDCATCEENGQVTCWDNSCADTLDDCPEEGECQDGFVLDCADLDCCPESWIGDGYEDCEEQIYGCDLTCYDNDGGDCGPSQSCEEQGLVECFDGSCAETLEDCESECPTGTVSDCSGDGDCCFETWIGDGYGDCEDQAYGCDLTCYDNDGGDCGGRSVGTKVNGLKKGYESSTFVKGHDLGRVVKLVKNSAIASKEGSMYSRSSEVRFNDMSNSTEIRMIFASVYVQCIEGPNEGFENTWTTSGTEFTVYGWEAGDYVCATVSLCSDVSGGCSEGVGPVCAYAGDTSSSECADGGDDCPSEAGSGDVNGDGSSDVLDIVQIVNVILGGDFDDDCAAAAADVNGDGSADVLDIVQIVNGILGGRADVGDATSAKIIRSNGTVTLEANGYIGGVQMTLKHEADFSIELTDNALVADSKTTENETKLVIVAPEGEELFTHSGDFEITDMIVANSEGRIDVGVPTEFSLSTAYPNPFNPTTSMMLSVPEAGMVSVQVYNLMGQVVATLASDYMDANTYTLTWDASEVSSGMYLVKAEAAGTVTTQKLMLMK